MADDDFKLWLGRIGKDPGFRASVRRASNLAGGGRRWSGGGRRFTGARLGRGSATGSLLGSTAGRTDRSARRVLVKARIARLSGSGIKAAAAHLRYLQRDGTTRDGERGMLYAADRDEVDGKAFLERGAEDRHQFRFIVSAEDGAQYDDLRPLVRRLMAQAEQDLETRLDWVAVDHFNTGHPHSHILVRGKDETGQNLVIARNYIAHGLSERAAEIVNRDLGPRSAREIAVADAREIAQERFTSIDRRLLSAVDRHGLVAPHHRDGVEQSLRAGRLATLARMGLASEATRGRWRLDHELERTLRAMGKRGDIIATLDLAARERRLDVAPTAYAIYDPASDRAPIVGRLVDRGLDDHDEDRSYLIVDGIDGRAHYIPAGDKEGLGGDLALETIVRVSPAPVEVREVDRTVAEIAKANGGFYAAELHAMHDASASERYIAAHVRRLEALRRVAGAAERDAHGLWHIAPDHLERALAYERERVRAEPVRVEILASMPLDRLAHHDGITALDEDRDLADPGRLGGGFGRKVADALARRRLWLVEQGLADRPDALGILRRRELTRVAARLSRELGLGFIDKGEGSRVEGTYRRSVQVGALRMAVIEESRGVALVPWRPVLERRLGREVAGVVRGNDVNWSLGRQRPGLAR